MDTTNTNRRLNRAALHYALTGTTIAPRGADAAMRAELGASADIRRGAAILAARVQVRSALLALRDQREKERRTVEAIAQMLTDCPLWAPRTHRDAHDYARQLVNECEGQ